MLYHCLAAPLGSPETSLKTPGLKDKLCYQNHFVQSHYNIVSSCLNSHCSFLSI